MFKRFVICTVAVLMSVGLLWAHDGNEHIMGTVSSINGDHVMIKTLDGKSEMVMLGKTTKYLIDKKAAKLTDIKVGSRVVVDAKMDPKMKMYSALEVQIGVATPLKSDAKATTVPADNHSGHK
jgi:hypothetical protein